MTARRLAAAVTVTGAACLAVLGVAAGPSTALAHPAVPTASPAVGWGLARAIAAPGRTDAIIDSLSCAGPGDCVAGGSGVSRDTTTAFLAEEKNGSWGATRPVPGLVALATGYTSVNAVSCAPPGNCAAVGEYEGGGGTFVADERGGTWRNATPLPGITASATSGSGAVVSCTAAGDCVAIVTCTNADDEPEVFVVREQNGTWSGATALPGFAALKAVTDTTEDNYLSCPSTGNCAAAGTYVDASGHYVSFVAAERDGAWSAVKVVPDAQFDAISCPSAGNCVAAGDVRPNPRSGAQAGFAAEKNGSWARPTQTPGITALKGEEFAEITGASCRATGDCTVAGTYYASDGGTSAFIDTETRGNWGRAEQVPGLAALSVQGTATGLAVGCGSPGNCSVGGSYAYSTYQRAFLAQQTDGTWGNARTVTGLPAPGNIPQEAVTAISCAPAGRCGATGVFSPTGTENLAAFAVSQVPLHATATVLALTAGRVVYGHEQAAQAVVAVSAAVGIATGTVTVRSGAATACTLTLHSSTGTCTLPGTRLAAGKARLTAVYGGGIGLAQSVSAPRTLTVVRAATSTRLKPSAGTVTYGDEQAERLTVTVIPRYAGTATGTVTVKTGSTTVCTIRLTSARTAACTLTAKELAPGTYALIARYPGSADFTASTSGKATLKVVQ